MKNLIVGILVGVALTAAGLFFVTRMRSPVASAKALEQKPEVAVPSGVESSKQLLATNAPVEVSAPAGAAPAKVEESQSPTNATMEKPSTPVPAKEEPAVASLSEQLKKRQQLTSEELEKLKHSIAVESPEIDVPEIWRDAEVSSARLLNKHGGKLYKLSGLILEINPYDVVIVIKNTELVCSFADQSWKSEGLRVNGYLYACGFFESYKREGDFKQISMANCSTIENFYKLRTTPPTEEEKAQSLRGWEADKLYKLSRDLGERKLRQGP